MFEDLIQYIESKQAYFKTQALPSFETLSPTSEKKVVIYVENRAITLL